MDGYNRDRALKSGVRQVPRYLAGAFAHFRAAYFYYFGDTLVIVLGLNIYMYIDIYNCA